MCLCLVSHNDGKAIKLNFKKKLKIKACLKKSGPADMIRDLVRVRILYLLFLWPRPTKTSSAYMGKCIQNIFTEMRLTNTVNRLLLTVILNLVNH